MNAAALRPEDLAANSRKTEGGQQEAILVLPAIHCGGCVAGIERNIARIKGINSVRVNLTSKRMTVKWQGDEAAPAILDVLRAMGHEPRLLAQEEQGRDKTLDTLIKALAVAGFGASNIMILSVAVWSGVEEGTRTLFHWLSALIALPVVVYSGRIFFTSAFRALRRFETNMDVPISLGIVLACALSLHDTLQGGRHAYFDAAVSLIFFLLIGRTLDHLMRVKAGMAVGNLARLVGHSATVEENGACRTRPLADIRPGMTLVIAAGQRIPVDARVVDGVSDVDGSLVSGESVPFSACVGTVLRAGFLNLSAPIRVEALSGAGDSFLSEMTALMEGADRKKSRYHLLADRASRIYTPLAHLAALATFAGWMFFTGDFHAAATVAITVLIITCPCALGLAVPMVQVIASRRLFSRGIVVKSGEALERLHDADKAVFDKTGTLTLSEPALADTASCAPENLAIARRMAVFSRHPYCRALVAGAEPAGLPYGATVRDIPGCGLEMSHAGDVFRLGRADWALGASAENKSGTCVLAKNGQLLETFAFKDVLREDAVETVRLLEARGMATEILSGDTPQVVGGLASALGVATYAGAMTPQAKIDRLNELAAAGKKVVMIGDGLNDLPALAAAHVSFAPSGANDVSQKAADFVLLDGRLGGMIEAMAVAKQARRLVLQNFGLAAFYNVLALPFAMAGLVTPLWAALAMSASSIVVVANALRLSSAGKGEG